MGCVQELERDGQLTELRKLVGEARGKRIEAEDCDVAEEALAKIEKAIQSPGNQDSRKAAEGAMAMLKGTAVGFGKLVDIGEKFGKVLKMTEPLLVEVFKQTS